MLLNIILFILRSSKLFNNKTTFKKIHVYAFSNIVPLRHSREPVSWASSPLNSRHCYSKRMLDIDF